MITQALIQTVVLVHGAFADGSSWDKVIPLLQAKGMTVIAVQNPTSSLEEDVEYTNRALAEAKGDVVLVGHSWGGAVITQAGVNPKVKSLVYVAAFAPEKGGTAEDRLKAFPMDSGVAKAKVDAQGFAKLPPEIVRQYFAQDLSPMRARIMAATQGASNVRLFGSKLTEAAWETKPSWFAVAMHDRMINPALQEAQAKQMNAKTIKLNASHVPMLSQPARVAKLILEAAGYKAKR